MGIFRETDRCLRLGTQIAGFVWRVKSLFLILAVQIAVIGCGGPSKLEILRSEIKEIEGRIEKRKRRLHKLLHPRISRNWQLQEGKAFRCKRGEIHFLRMEESLGYGYRCYCKVEQSFKVVHDSEQSMQKHRNKWFCGSYFQEGGERTYLDAYVTDDSCSLQFQYYAGNLCKMLIIRRKI